MHVIDVPDPGRISGDPDDTITVLDKPHTMYGSTIRGMELRLYTVQNGWLITAHIDMDGHTIETTYEEGRGGDTPLQNAAGFLMHNMGPAGAILRAKIALEAALDQLPGKV